jgi:predicted methyltransferase
MRPMKTRLLALALFAAPLACGPSSPEPVSPDPVDATTTPATTPSDTAAAGPAGAPAAEPAAAPAAAPKAEPTAEDKKKAEAARQLAADRAKWETEAKAEDARWTPALHTEAKALAEAKYASLDAALKAVLKGKHRSPAHVERDQHRHPLETLKFFGMTPEMTVLEYGPGEGWYTELLAPTLATKGKLIVTTPDPKGPADARSTFYGQRFQRFLEKAPEIYGKIETVVVDGKNPKFGLEGKADMVLVFRAMHGLHRDKLLQPVLAEAFKALKPNGVLGVEQHRAKADANPDESAKQGYLPEAFVIKEVEAAGFKLAGKSEINANPKDTKDHPEGVWTLPPTFELGDKDRAKYAAIGESDRMTLKFVKPKK